ncbi:cytochrome c oxidase assembly protein [Modestobacter lapidis]|nr:cytochrome c oxidase assembly protein [Modestobacter lapidis]
MTGAALLAHGTATGPPAWLIAAALPLAGGALYLAGVVALARRGAGWPPGRLRAALAAAGCAAVALAPPVTARADTFPGHVAQHLLLTMLVPLLLALSAPVTLALRTLPRRPRRVLLGALRSRPARVLTAPAVVVVLELGSLAAVYLTPLYGLLHASAALHLLVHGHMVLTGCLVSWLLVGADPMPRRPGTPVRLVVLVVLAAGHAVLAKTLFATTPAALGAAGEVRRGAQLLYYGGDVIELLLAVAVMAEWWRRTGRRLRAEQRRELASPASDRSV